MKLFVYPGAKQILTASPSDNWRTPPVHPCTTWMKTMHCSRSWNQWTCPSMKQLTRLGIVYYGDWCLFVALLTH